MAGHSFDGQEPSAADTGEPVHNSVLIRTHEPPRESHRWLAPTLLGVAILTGAIIWGVMATHPAGPLENHAVASAPTSFLPTKAS